MVGGDRGDGIAQVVGQEVRGDQDLAARLDNRRSYRAAIIPAVPVAGGLHLTPTKR